MLSRPSSSRNVVACCSGGCVHGVRLYCRSYEVWRLAWRAGPPLALRGSHSARPVGRGTSARARNPVPALLILCLNVVGGVFVRKFASKNNHFRFDLYSEKNPSHTNVCACSCR